MEKVLYQVNSAYKRTGVAMLISDKQSRSTKRDRGHFLMIKGST